jgi:hypothetical protein
MPKYAQAFGFELLLLPAASSLLVSMMMALTTKNPIEVSWNLTVTTSL